MPDHITNNSIKSKPKNILSYFKLPRISRAKMELINDWYAHAEQYAITCNKKKINSVAKASTRTPNTENLITYDLKSSFATAKIHLEPQALEALLASYMSLKLQEIDLQDTSLLLEFIFDEILEKFEQSYETSAKLSFAPQQGYNISQFMISAEIFIENSNEPFHIWFDSDDQSAEQWRHVLQALNQNTSVLPLTYSLQIIPLYLLLSAVELKLSQLKALEKGDVIIIENFVDNTCQISAGLETTWSAKTTEQSITLASKPLSYPLKYNNINNEEVNVLSTSDNSNHPIDDIPVMIAFEVGRKEVSVRELKNFTEGTVIDFPNIDQNNIQILANGTLIGQGSLIQIGEEMGVKIDRIFNDD